MKHAAFRPAHRGRPINLSSFRSFLSPHRPLQVSAPFPRPLQAPGGSSTVANAARFTVALPFTAVWPACVSLALLAHWLCGPLSALYGSVAGASAAGAAVWA